MMRNIILLSVLLCSSFNMILGQEIWDKETSTYVNHDVGFHWNLIRGVDWIKIPTNNENTVFKATSDVGITVFVSTRNLGVDSGEHDACDFIEELKQEYGTMLRKRDAFLGSKSEIKYIVCSNFSGRDAIKIVIKCSLSDDIHNESYYEISYNFLKREILFGVVAQIMEEAYYYLDESDIKSIFYGFGLNAK